jgi:lysophospholipase
MHQHSDSVQTTDGLRLHVTVWLPDGAPQAVVLLVHGIAEHAGRYQHVAQRLADIGCAVYAPDHRTHGRSEGQPRVYITDFQQAAADLLPVLALAQQAHPGLPAFIYGHSMGSFLSTLFTLNHQDRLNGFISSGSPLLIDTIVAPLLVTASSVLASLAPRLPVVDLQLEAISRDPAVVTAYMADPYCAPGKVKAGMGYAYLQAVRPVRARLGELHLPLLVLHGAADRIAPSSGSELLYEQARSADKTLKLYPGLYHEIHNEPEQADVLADITAWLEARIRG